jgi:single-strand DNA-binding protein
MSARSLNKVQLIGNLTRDPELRYTPSGTAVCTFGLATNRSWTTQSGEVKEETEFHRIVSWNKLAELCSQLLVKGRKVYVEGRLSTRTWTGQDNLQRTTTEIVIEDMIILDSKKPALVKEEIPEGMPAAVAPQAVTTPAVPSPVVSQSSGDVKKTKRSIKQEGSRPKEEIKDTVAVKGEKSEEVKSKSEEINPDDIPF